ncbi:uncharacterized protein LOC129276853 [Lytechinus pictus]|uniref:uncharacterized protein LOC129276853 n=1 Tax=Lytechinus pictus TaxID=7653 RepID=UPI0030B9DEE4
MRGDKGGNTALHNAAKRGHTAITEHLVEQGADIKKCNDEGWTALHSASKEGHTDIIDFLISRGIDANIADQKGMTPLHIASGKGHLDCTKRLVCGGSDIHKFDDGGCTALHIAAKEGHANVMKFLVHEGKNVVNTGDKNGLTPLQFASLYGHLECTRLLASITDDINKGDSSGLTSLHRSAENNKLDVTKYLVNQGARITEGDKDGRTALHVAALNGHTSIIKYLASELNVNVDTFDSNGRTPLHNTTWNGHTEATNYLISKGAKVNRRNNKGWTPLHLASQNGHLEVTKCLIANRAEVDKSSKDGKSPLHSAARNTHLPVAKYLIDNGALVNKDDNGGWTPLHIAALSDNLDFTEYLISEGALVNSRNQDGWTALHNAAGNGKLKVTCHLVSQGAEINIGNKDGWTALHKAAQNGHMEVTKCLIQNGALVNQGNNEGRTAMHNAAGNGHVKILEYLIKEGGDINLRNDYGMTVLHNASKNCQLDMTKYLISKGLDVNSADIDGWTPLHSASKNGHLEITEYLISQQAEVNRSNKEGADALHIASGNGRSEVASYLIKYGADISREDVAGRTALHYAARRGHLEVAKELLNQGADVKACTKNGLNALHYAAENGHSDITTYLINEGIDITKCDDNGSNALHKSARNGHRHVASCLINKGASVNTSSNDGWTAFIGAAENGHKDMVEYLLTQGANVNVSDKNGFTALHAAAANGHLGVVQYLVRQGVDLNKGDSNDNTAMHRAFQNGCLDVYVFLMSHGSSMNDFNVDGNAPRDPQPDDPQSESPLIDSEGKVNQLDSHGFAAIHHAMHHGYTSVIETLLSQGADINIQSGDGQTCLHHAIKLCYRTDREVEPTETLKKISTDFYHGDLSPKRALVIYLLENGANTDMRDTYGNLPIQFARDEQIRQMIFSRLPSMERITSYREEKRSSCNKLYVEVGKGPKQVELEDHGISINFPAGSFQEPEPYKIMVSILHRPSVGIDIADDESVACCGIRLDPADVAIQKPVKITMPHSISCCDPDRVTPDIVSLLQHTGWTQVSRRSYMPSSKEPPFCKVHKGYIDLYINQCAEWWILIPLKQRSGRQRVVFTPYVPDIIGLGQELLIRLHIHTDSPFIEEQIHEEEREKGYRKTHRSVPFEVVLQSGDINLLCERDDREVGKKLICLADIRNQIRQCVDLEVRQNVRETSEFHLMTIVLSQVGSRELSRSLSFVIRCRDEPPSPISIYRPKEEMLRHDLSDIELNNIAEEITVDQYYDLGVALGFNIPQLDNLEYSRLRNREQATYDMLVQWRKGQGHEAKKELLSVIKSVGTPREQIDIQALNLDTKREIPDETLVALAREMNKMKEDQFFKVGKKLGLKLTVLQHILYRTLSRMKDATVQMLSKWKTSQRNKREALRMLKSVWKSLQSATKRDASDLQTTAFPDEDIDLLEVGPTKKELLSVAREAQNVETLGKALGVDDDIISKCLQSIGTTKPKVLRVVSMLQDWVKLGGTRARLLEIAQALHFNDAALTIAKAGRNQEGCTGFFSCDAIDHWGRDLNIEELGIRLSIPPGCVKTGRTSLATLHVFSHSAFSLPVRDDEILISPVVECSLKVEETSNLTRLNLRHNLNLYDLHDLRQRDHLPCLILYRKKELGYFERIALEGTQISDDTVEIPCCDSQMLATSLTNLQAVKFHCVAFQPLYMPSSRNPVLHFHIFLPCRRYLKDIVREEGRPPMPYCRMMDMVPFNVHSGDTDLTIRCNDGSESTRQLVSIRRLVKENCSIVIQLCFLEGEEQKTLCLCIEQGTSTLVRHVFTTTIEAFEPDYDSDTHIVSLFVVL